MNSTHQRKTQILDQKSIESLEQSFAKSHDLLNKIRQEIV